ncbi:hypothetical protein HQ585_18080 [candidate division KSB1 bacterium]|nr:hypothetical protein [candidate division KSB1 bacterium]
MNHRNRDRGLLTTAFLLFLFFYTRFAIQPEIIYQAQEPVFFKTARFFVDFLGIPGGLTAYTAACLSQFYILPWIGAAVITLIIGGIVSLTHLWLNRLQPERTDVWLHLIPGLFLLMLHSHYHHPLSMTLGLLLAMAGLVLYTSIPIKNVGLRFLFYAILCGLLFYLSIGAMLIFAVLGALFEWTKNRSVKGALLGLIFLCFAGTLPWIATMLTMITPKQAYLTHFWIASRYPVGWAPAGLYITLIFLAFIPFWLPLFRKLSSIIGDRIKRIPILKKTGWICRIILISLLTWAAAHYSLSRDSRTLYQAVHHTREKNWDTVLEVISGNPMNHILIQHLSARALHHSGRLLDDLFSYPHAWGKQGLLLSYQFNYSAPKHMCDFCMDIGHLNEAEHWTYETLTLGGETPWILHKLAEINLLKGETDMARICINKLRQTLLHQALADDCEQLARNLAAGRTGAYPFPIRTDFIINKHKLEEDLQALRELMPQNRMVFEFNIASLLFDKDLEGLYNQIGRLPEFGIRTLPRHWQEAMILRMLKPDGSKLDLAGYKLNSSLIQNLQNFQQALLLKADKRVEAYNELAPAYGNTYWYYLIFEEVAGNAK